jgi:hypothetical protein
MYGSEADSGEILEGLRGRRDFEGREGEEETWSYQRQNEALQSFNMDVLLADNVDAIFAKYRPGTFLPALCHVFMDTDAPVDVLDGAARAIAYFMDVHVDSTARKVVEVPGAVKAFCLAARDNPCRSVSATGHFSVLHFWATHKLRRTKLGSRREIAQRCLEH